MELGESARLGPLIWTPPLSTLMSSGGVVKRFSASPTKMSGAALVSLAIRFDAAD
jgi:hypothetical protein